MAARATQKRLISAIPADRAQLEQLAHRAPENPETSRHPPEILAPDPPLATSTPSAGRISTGQNMPRAEPSDRERPACSNREHAQNNKRTTNPLQSIEIVRVFQCSTISLAHIRVCMRARIRIPPKTRNSENSPDCRAITKAYAFPKVFQSVPAWNNPPDP